jgi:hypothetical protein
MVPLALACVCGGSSVENTADTAATSVDESYSPDLTAAETFVDPQRTYTITIASPWAEIPGAFVKEIEAWTIAEPVDGFAANVNVLTQDALDADLATYMGFSVNNLGALELIEHETVKGTNGNDLGLLEYKGAVPGAPPDRPLHILQTIDVRNGNAVVATLTTDEDDFDIYRSIVEPFLLSLQAT